MGPSKGDGEVIVEWMDLRISQLCPRGNSRKEVILVLNPINTDWAHVQSTRLCATGRILICDLGISTCNTNYACVEEEYYMLEERGDRRGEDTQKCHLCL